VVTEISDPLGLGKELYINKKKVDMLQDPSDYFMERNKVLLKEGASTASAYANSLDNVAKAVTGKANKKDAAYIVASNQLWGKSLAHDMTAKLASIELGVIDIKYPILDRPRSPRILESWKQIRSLSRKGVSNYIPPT